MIWVLHASMGPYDVVILITISATFLRGVPAPPPKVGEAVHV